MKESETPLGKAFVKAKKTSAPPPAPNPYDVEVNVQTKESGKDAATRRYQTLAVKNLNSNWRAKLAYDRVDDKLKIIVANAKTDKVAVVSKFEPLVKPYDSFIRNAILDSVRSIKGQPVSDTDLQKAMSYFTQIADYYTPLPSDKKPNSGLDA